MTTATTTLTAACGGGSHLQFSISGPKELSVMVMRDEASAAITDDEAVAFVKCLLKLGKVGRTNAQLAALFQAGVTVTV